MTRKELQAALDRLGADLSRWPAPLRQKASALVAVDPLAARLVAAERQNAALIGEAVEAVPIDAAFIGRMVDGAREPGTERSLVLSRRLAAWASVAMIVAVLGGFAAGFAVAPDETDSAAAALLFGTGSGFPAGGIL
jgi:hypothetical protein